MGLLSGGGGGGGRSSSGGVARCLGVALVVVSEREARRGV
jgi:hypothetical protein